MSNLLDFKSYAEMANYIQNHSVDFLDLCFTDATGRMSHIMISSDRATESALKSGFPFDGSSLSLLNSIKSSDMLALPDFTTCWTDDFYIHNVVHVTCTLVHPNGKESVCCPRTICKNVEKYLESSGISDLANIGLEAEFFIFDSVKYDCSPFECHFLIEPPDGTSAVSNLPTPKQQSKVCQTHFGSNLISNYAQTLPLDCYSNLRNEIAMHLKKVGIIAESNHSEVAHFQNEISYKYQKMVKAADQLVSLKYITKNISNKHSLTATFMPKPIHNLNGSGMHCNISLWKDNKNLFYGGIKDNIVVISDLAKKFIGGIFAHAKSISAFTNPSVNSYRRLIHGFEAPTYLVYSTGNRSAAVRVPILHAKNPDAIRIEVRFPDSSGSTHLSLAAIVLAGIDGIKRGLDPGEEFVGNAESLKDISNNSIDALPHCLYQSLIELDKDRDYLLAGNCFTNEFIDKYIAYKRKEINECAPLASVKEFQLYYNA